MNTTDREVSQSMAQSSNYKQYTRSTRILTEETGFAGGMLWTGNNIDETHLRAAVNFDYDDTTGYLKTRPGFTAYEHSPTDYDLEQLNVDLTGYSLLNVYNICPFDYADTDNETLMDAGWLYLFAKPEKYTEGWRVEFYYDRVIGVFRDSNNAWHVCDVTGLRYALGFFSIDTTLRNIDKKRLLTVYDNYLYGIGSNAVSFANEDAWLHVYRLKNIAPYRYRLHSFEPSGWGEAVLPSDQYCKRVGDTIIPLEEWEAWQPDVFYEREARNEPPETSVMDYEEFPQYGLEAIPYNKVADKFRSVTLTEACVTGFNAARGQHAFTYAGAHVDSAGDIAIQGVYLTDAKGNPVISPTPGHKYKLNVLVDYQNDNGHLAMFALKDTSEMTAADAANVWTHRDTQRCSGGLCTFDVIFNTKKTTLMFTYFGQNNPEPVVYSADALAYFGPYTITASDNSQNLKIKHYDLNTVSGSCVWRNRMCLWGSDGNHNSLFLSDVDNFYYFPIPNNVAVFETNIISCIPYKDTLLVFTADKIYRMSENNDGTFTQTVVQNDMPLSQEDAAQLTAIKNMILFKSGKYFYMIVPKSQSLTDELTIAPIYKNIAGFLNNLDKGVQDVLQLMYPEYYFKECTIRNDGNPTSVYSEQDTVHILYDVKATIQTKAIDAKDISYKLFLNYNTNLRAWTVYIEDTTEHSLEVAAPTSARQTTFVRINHNTGDFSVVVKQTTEAPAATFRALIDTGYRTLSSATQKRFREVQLKLYSASENTTAFGTAFLVDGVWRRSYSKLQEYISADNTVSLMPELDLNTLGAEFNTFITELTMPISSKGEVQKMNNENESSDSIELTDWNLDFSHFKRGAPVTIRIPVSGKGYNPRFIFMTPVKEELSVNEVNWVYRLMHGR